MRKLLGGLFAVAVIVVTLAWVLTSGPLDSVIPTPETGTIESRETAISPERLLEADSTERSRLASDLNPDEEPNKSQEVVKAPEPAQPTFDTKEWSAYERSSVDELTVERQRLRDQLSTVTSPLLWAQVNSGNAERLSDNSEFSYQHRSGDPSEIFGIMGMPDRGVFRASLPREAYADLYVIKDLTIALGQLIAAKRREVALK